MNLFRSFDKDEFFRRLSIIVISIIVNTQFEPCVRISAPLYCFLLRNPTAADPGAKPRLNPKGVGHKESILYLHNPDIL